MPRISALHMLRSTRPLHNNTGARMAARPAAGLSWSQPMQTAKTGAG